MIIENKSHSLDEYIDSIDDEIISSIQPRNLDEVLIIFRQQNESNRINTILEVWKDQQTEERKLRKRYANWFVFILIIQLLFVNAIFIYVGLKRLEFGRWEIHTFIVSVFGEITGIVIVIVRYLFTSTSKEMINLIKDLK